MDVLEVVCVAGEGLLPHAAELACLRVLAGREGKASPVPRPLECELDVEELGVKEGRLPQLPWRAVLEREDCCVEDLSLRTRRPEETLAPMLEEALGVAEGSGREG